jgi:hypothetical protein
MIDYVRVGYRKKAFCLLAYRDYIEFLEPSNLTWTKLPVIDINSPLTKDQRRAFIKP